MATIGAKRDARALDAVGAGLYRLLYFSRPLPELTPADIDAILAASARNNPGLGVTGFLAHVSAGDDDAPQFAFIQLLEGPAASVRSLFEAVARDPRHSCVTVAAHGPIEARRYADWSMSLELLGDVETAAALAEAAVRRLGEPLPAPDQRTLGDQAAAFWRMAA